MPQPISCNQTSQADHAPLYEILIGELTDVAVFLMDVDGCIMSWNPGVERLLGYTEAEWLGRSAEIIFTPEDLSQGKYQEEMSKASRDGRATNNRWHVRYNGELLYVEGTMVALRGEGGQLLGFSKVMRDVTESQRKQERNAFLMRLDEALRPLVTTDEMMSIVTRLLGEHLKVDSVAYCWFEADEVTLHIAGDYTRPGVTSLVGSYSLNLFGAAAAQSLRANHPYLLEDVERDPRTADVRELYRRIGICADLGVPVHKAGRLVAAVAVHQRTPRHWRPEEVDLVHRVANRCWESCERARTEAARQLQWQTLNTALSNTPDLIYIFDLQGRFTYANRPLLELWQKSLDEALGKNIFEFGYPSEVASRISCQIQEVIETKQIARDQTPLVTPSGEVRHYEYIFAPVLDEQGRVKAVSGSSREITERHLTSEVLRKSEERLTLALEASGAVGTWDWDLVKDRIYADTRFARLFSVDPERAAAGAPAQEYIEGIHPDDRALVSERIQLAIDTNEDYAVDYRVHPNGAMRWVHSRGRCFRNAEGKPLRLPGVVIDITDRKQVEEDLQRLNRELEEFAYVASHDLQEPLRTVNIYTQQLLRKFIGSNPEAQEYAGLVRNGVSRMQALIQDLLTYSCTVHRGILPVGSADLSASLTDALATLKDRIDVSGAAITAPSLPVVRGETQQLSNVFQNLISNALKYCRKDVTPQIDISVETHENHVVIAVQDNGIGFEQKYAEQIFGLFNRLHKEEYAGTGLGLAICHRIIERYGGRIWAQGRPGEGATFFFVLLHD